MKIETQLPLGNLDPGLRAAAGGLDLARVGEEAQFAEVLGYDGIVTEETKDDPFIVLALAAQATERIGLATGVAIAFPRAPAVTALAAWTLQRLSKGRFTLGLGSQVKGHIERRYGMNWTPPGPWMRDYVGALRAIWECWQNGGTKLDYESAHYKLSLMVPLFAPPPIEHPHIRVQLAAVNPFMCQIAGEVAEGIRAHPVCTPGYIRDVMLPAARKGAAKVGRDFAEFEIAAMPLVATAPDRAGLEARVRDVRARIAFYASTPTYLIAFESQGHGEIARSLQGYSRAQRWEEMPGFISDEMLDHYAVIGTHDEIASKLDARFAGVASHLEFAIPIGGEADKATLGELLKSLR
ncbi:MAG TPA: TIGR03617 family F420-dependent LLM class oxidoreductase [Stellaceae bacterium]|nr:TIGR03617 family F420-dependent LLM class oxidoreductase [Stellaceae bacterium]